MVLIIWQSYVSKYCSGNNFPFYTYIQTLSSSINRYKIIIGLGSTLQYLYVEWEQCVVHGDIKPSNIMLDSSLDAKMGDFGLARLIDHGVRPATTKVVLGTAGYIDPELVNTRCPSAVSDVYSFDVVLLELITGRRPVEEPDDNDDLFMLVRWV